jgi:hypothetical protein
MPFNLLTVPELKAEVGRLQDGMKRIRKVQRKLASLRKGGKHAKAKKA